MLKTSASTRFPQNYKRVAISYPRFLGSTIQQLTEEAKTDIAKVGDQVSIYFSSGPYATWDVNPRIKGPEDFAVKVKYLYKFSNLIVSRLAGVINMMESVAIFFKPKT